MKTTNRKLADKEYIDCNQCAAYECYVDEEDLDDQVQRQDELDESISEWIADLAECTETGSVWNNLDVYIGAMCSSYGDGVELGVFVNDECTMYTTQESFNNVYSNYQQYNEDNEYGIDYLQYAEGYIKNAFGAVMPCLQKEYADPNEEEDEDNGNNDEEEEYEVNDYCQQIMEGDVANFNNCAVDEDANDEEDNDDQYNWYNYDLKEADDIDEVCVTLNNMAGEYSYVFDEVATGTWYGRNKEGQIVNDEGSEGFNLSPGVIAVIVGVCVVVVGGAALLLKPKNKRDSNEAVYQGGTMS